MRYEGFNVYDDEGNLVETLPAVVWGGGRVGVSEGVDISVVAQMPPGSTVANFYNDRDDTLIAQVPVVDGVAELKFSSLSAENLTVRVGNRTRCKQNVVGVVFYED